MRMFLVKHVLKVSVLLRDVSDRRYSQSVSYYMMFSIRDVPKVSVLLQESGMFSKCELLQGCSQSMSYHRDVLDRGCSQLS